MSICDICEGEIDWRTINGARIPLRVTCTCQSDSPKTSLSTPRNPINSVKTERWKYADEVRPTSCPICGISPVYFIRHNGGCAWFEHLGMPWTKHPCFDHHFLRTSYTEDTNKTQETFDFIRKHMDYSASTIIGIIIEINEKDRGINICTLQGNHIFSRVTASDWKLFKRTGAIVAVNIKEKTIAWSLTASYIITYHCDEVYHVVFTVGTRYFLDYDNEVQLTKIEPSGIDKMLTVVSLKMPKSPITFRAASGRVLP